MENPGLMIKTTPIQERKASNVKRVEMFSIKEVMYDQRRKVDPLSDDINSILRDVSEDNLKTTAFRQKSFFS